MQDDAREPDEVRRFIVENLPLRGHWVRLDTAWRELREHKDYPPATRELLGQAVSASVLLAATLKFRGTLTLQLQGDGAVRLLVAQCTHDFRVRALARVDGARVPPSQPQSEATQLTPTQFRHLVGAEGRLAVTVEAAEREMRYQGIVPLTGRSFSECLETYFASSEQLPTRVTLAADESRATGLLLQRLPGERDEPDSTAVEEVWRDAQRGVNSISRAQLLNAAVEQVLLRNLGPHDVRLFKGSPVVFECRCGPTQVANLLRALGAEEMRDLLQEQGAVTVTCDFCNRPYRFDDIDIARLFAPTVAPDAPRLLQ